MSHLEGQITSEQVEAWLSNLGLCCAYAPGLGTSRVELYFLVAESRWRVYYYDGSALSTLHEGPDTSEAIKAYNAQATKISKKADRL